MKKMIVKSYAKINLCLDVVGQREDGYHLLDMIMLPLELHDTLILETTLKSTNFVTLDDFAVGNSQYNTVSNAIDRIDEIKPLNTKFRINLHKVIPMKAGLGGGSSNAAFIIKAISEYKRLDLTNEEMYQIATKIGADVPFFITNKPARCRGIGEQIEPINVKNNYHVLIVKPEGGCGTKEVYELCDKEKNWPHGGVDIVKKALEEGDDELLASSIFNVLEQSSIKLVPEIQTIKDELKEMGFKIVLMSGSGSAVFALSTDKKFIKKAAKKLENKYNVIVTKVLK